MSSLSFMKFPTNHESFHKAIISQFGLISKVDYKFKICRIWKNCRIGSFNNLKIVSIVGKKLFQNFHYKRNTSQNSKPNICTTIFLLKIRKFLLEEGKWSLCEKCPYSYGSYCPGSYFTDILRISLYSVRMRENMD